MEIVQCPIMASLVFFYFFFISPKIFRNSLPYHFAFLISACEMCFASTLVGPPPGLPIQPAWGQSITPNTLPADVRRQPATVVEVVGTSCCLSQRCQCGADQRCTPWYRPFVNATTSCPAARTTCEQHSVGRLANRQWFPDRPASWCLSWFGICREEGTMWKACWHDHSKILPGRETNII